MISAPSKEEFIRLAGKCNIIPVYAEISMDMDTPVSIYYKLVGDEAGFILESAEASKNFGRYSFIGAQPFARLTARKNVTEIVAGQHRRLVKKAPLAALKEYMQTFSFPRLPNLPPLIGGAVGYFAYESVATWERVRGVAIDDETILAQFLFCRNLLVMDHLTHSATLMVLARVEPGENIGALYDKAAAELERIIANLQRPAAMPGTKETNIQSDVQLDIPGSDSEIGKDYMAMVEQAKEFIKAGEIFQVVLSHQFRCKLNKHPFALYRRLRQVNPSHYMFYMQFGEQSLVGASPERLVKLQDGEVLLYPIAGTRPRGKDEAEDAKLAAELLTDEKEKAEHAMLVDLGRNDVGRISLPGTVKVRRMMEVEKFSHVMHLVSEVAGQIDPKYGALDVLAACFPAGTVSGAPKVRAMEIINLLEKKRRGPYAGAVGYLDFRGNMDTCITIRTLSIEGDEFTLQSGAGIVADSVPENEYQEILNKAQALFKVLGEDDEG
ncbi:MAG: anthranilate synthase component I [Veillonellales bacterium]